MIKRISFIFLNFIGVIFCIEVLLIVAYWLFGFIINFHNKIQVLINLSGIFLMVSVPIISFIDIYFFRKIVVSKILAFTYLSLWICVLIRIAFNIC